MRGIARVGAMVVLAVLAGAAHGYYSPAEGRWLSGSDWGGRGAHLRLRS